jgi:hypothetical protein
MADQRLDPEPDEGTPRRRGSEPRPRTPGWVIVLGIVALILILAVVVQFLLGIQHGPNIHGAL